MKGEAKWTRYNRLLTEINKSDLDETQKRQLFDMMTTMSAVEALEVAGQEFKKAKKEAKKQGR